VGVGVEGLFFGSSFHCVAILLPPKYWMSFVPGTTISFARACNSTILRFEWRVGVHPRRQAKPCKGGLFLSSSSSFKIYSLLFIMLIPFPTLVPSFDYARVFSTSL